MFDLFPDVEPLMLDLPIAPRRAASPRSDDRPAPGRTPFGRARDVVGRGLIAIGSSLVVDNQAQGRATGR